MIKILSQHEPNEIVFQFADDDLEKYLQYYDSPAENRRRPHILKKLRNYDLAS
jgi:hypothetical protein